MKKHKVVIKFLDGRMIKGYIDDISKDDETVSVEDKASEQQTIKMNDLKARKYTATPICNRGS